MHLCSCSTLCARTVFAHLLCRADGLLQVSTAMLQASAARTVVPMQTAGKDLAVLETVTGQSCGGRLTSLQ